MGFFGITGQQGGSSTTTSPQYTSGGSTSGAVEVGTGNVSENQLSATGNITQTNLTTGLPVNDVEGLLDTTFNDFSSSLQGVAGSISNAGINQQSAQAAAAAQSGISPTTLYVVGGAIVLLVILMVWKR
jgi:hypothetical protein